MSVVLALLVGFAQDPAPPEVPADRAALWAKATAEMKPYEATIPGSDVRMTMLPIPGGVYRMGSAEGEAGRRADEGPQRWVIVDPFWMGECEVTWDQYELWSAGLERKRRPDDYVVTPLDANADAVARPTPPYTDMTFGMGKEGGFPAICMTQHAAMKYCEWLGAKLGPFHRLPTEAEWEYACRAGTTTAYSFGDKAEDLDAHAWHRGNAEGAYHKVREKQPNPWGLYDIHGNVSEWCLDQMAAYEPAEGLLVNPYVVPTDEYPHVARGGSWRERESRLRSAARRGSSSEWKMRDPQIPQSIWYFTDAQFNGFRVVRPYVEPTPAERGKYLSKVEDHGR